MRTIVTGGAGFIGSHISEALLGAGHEVLAIDDLSRGKRDNLPTGARLEVASITDERVEGVIAAYKPAAVFHLAAQMDVRASTRDPRFDAEVNICGLIRVAKSAAAAGCQAMIFASTGGAIYGEQDVFPAAEDHPKRPESPYGLSKLCGEHYLDYFARTSTLRTVCLRYANVYGPRQDPHGEAGVVAIFAQKMLRGEEPTIFGDGKQTRDYVFIGDVVRANLLALENGAARGAYNIGTGVETDVNVLAAHIAKAASYDGRIAHAAAKPGEQRRSVIDHGKAKRELGWQPRMPLGDGIKTTVDWFRAQRA